MAKRKGKSTSRIKDWQRRWNGEEGFEYDQAGRQSFIRREFKIPDRQLAVGDENLDDLPRREGMVLGQFPGGAIVRVDGRALICSIAGTYRAPTESTAMAPGDIVTVAIIRPEHTSGELEVDKDRAEAVVLDRRERETALCRPEPQSGKRRDEYRGEAFHKVIVANMDVLLIMAATKQPPLRHGLIDRFLIIAQRGELEPMLVINKTDLARPDENLLAEFRTLGLEVLTCSAVTGDGCDALLAGLTDKRIVLAGASGVGKSTLINAIVPGAAASTRPIRMKDQRGRHTTSSAAVYDLPGGGMIVDTPGIRELGIQLDAAELPWYFPEFEQHAQQCKFRNCTHTHEPGCAVIQAVENGTIPPRRYQSFLNILQTL